MASEHAEAIRSVPWQRGAQEAYPGPAAVPGGPAGQEVIDRQFQALRARLTGGVSPVGFWLADLDWLAHLAGLRGRRAELVARARIRLTG